MATLQKAGSWKLQLAWQNVLQMQKTVKEADIAITAAAEDIASIMNALSAAKANAEGFTLSHTS